MNKLVEAFGGEKRWLNWRLGKGKQAKPTKIPIGSSTDPETWSTYSDLEKRLGKGIVFTPEETLLGVDIDHCLEGSVITHEEKQKIVDFLIEADTYTEISPSGEGLHIFLKLSDPLKLTSNKKSPFEAYTSGRYFTVTEKPYKEEKDVREVTSAEALRILAIIGYPWKEVESTAKKTGNVSAGALDDENVISKMFSSKNGAGVRRLYEGDLKRHRDDPSTADMALCSHLAFWTGGNEAQIERLWLASPLGNREKTLTRQDYRQRTIKAAIAKCKEFYEPPRILEIDGDIDLLFTLQGRNRDKIYTQNTENMCRILRKHHEFAGRFRFDNFKNVYEYKEGEKWRALEDADAISIQTRISIIFECFQKVGKEMVYDAIIKVSKENTYDSAVAFITGLVWDKKYRLDSWLSETYGVPADKYHKAVASNWLKGLVKRIIEPGCKFDYVLVLEGEQGAKKSTSLGILGGDWHVETTMSTDTKDFFMQFQGKAIVEFSEGETLSRTEVKRMKAIITMQSDKYRPPYERTSRDFPRRCVFAMTTNQSEYLKDETGNRRWLPVTVMLPEANIEWLAANRDQLLAEAYNRVFVKGETIYEFPKEETLEAQNLRRIGDPNTELIADWYWNILTDDQRRVGITIDQVFRQALHGGFSGKPKTKYEEMSIAIILKDYIRLTKRQSMVNGIRTSRWFVNPLYDYSNEEQAKASALAF